MIDTNGHKNDPKLDTIDLEHTVKELQSRNLYLNVDVDMKMKLMQDTNVELTYELDMKGIEIRRLKSELNTKEHSIETLKQKKKCDAEEMQSIFDSQRINLQNELKILRDQNEKQGEEFEEL